MKPPAMNEKSILTLSRDTLGIFVLGFTVFALIALLSYHPQDPSFNNFVSNPLGEVQNQGGAIGAYLADFLVQVFGSGAFFFPLVTLLCGWILVRGGQMERGPILLGAGILLLVNVCIWLFIQYSPDPYFGGVIKSGGITGAFLGTILVHWLNHIGAKLLVWTFIMVSLLAMTGLSVNTLIESTVKFLRAVILFIVDSSKTIAGLVANSLEKLVDFWREWSDRIKARWEEKSKEPPSSEPVIISRKLEQAEEPVPETKAKEIESEDFAVQKAFPFEENPGDYKVPPLSILDPISGPKDPGKAKEEILVRTSTLENKLSAFGVDGRVVQVLPGPVITLYEFEPAPGVKVSRILSLTDDLALAMRSSSVRILAPVPGKAVVGIEIPNPTRETVFFKEIISSESFTESPSKLIMALGKDNIGDPVALDLAQVPHLLIAGATGSGKSVGINALICSILLNASPDNVKMIMIDPKMLELSLYDGIPHLISPVVTNPKKAAAALEWAVSEMERRYSLMADKGVRNIKAFNQLVERQQKERAAQKKAEKKKMSPETSLADSWEDNAAQKDEESAPLKKLPYVVIIIDELADLMMVASKAVEECLTRLAQMARAAGIHLIIATQRPSVDVLTGIIKANFPARVAFQVVSRVDSRTILDSTGAEKLLGKGDMLFLPPSTSSLRRIHGVMVNDDEINRIIRFIKEQQEADYHEDIFDLPVDDQSPVDDDKGEFDEKYDEAVALVANAQQASISMVQRRLRVGYNRAARMIEIMEKEGVVGPPDGIKPREVYVKPASLD
ncbi:MAG: DNA translocase FtsK [Nitrospinota bacterium]|nr:DNA translocase FtsK [Nitrospinota bacterium]